MQDHKKSRFSVIRSLPNHIGRPQKVFFGNNSYYGGGSQIKGGTEFLLGPQGTISGENNPHAKVAHFGEVCSDPNQCNVYFPLLI